MKRVAIAGVALGTLLSAYLLPAQNASPAATLISKDNRVESATAGGGWSAASAGQALDIGDRIKTGEDSRAVVRMADGSVLQLDEFTTIEIKPPKGGAAGATLNVPSGGAFFFSRGGRQEVAIETPGANGAIRGTAFLLTVGRSDGRTIVSMIEGVFQLSSQGGSVTARQGEQARAAGGGASKGVLGDTGDTGPWYLVIENQLPLVQALRGVGKSQFLSALPDAIKDYRQVAPQLAGGATLVRREWARDILREAFQTIGGDCNMRARILSSVIAAAPEDASALTELAVALGPNCADKFGGAAPVQPSQVDEGEGNFDNAPNVPGQNLPGTPIGGAGGASGNVVAICHNNRTLFVSPQGAANHLNNHPGDTLGPCQVTPVQNP